MQTGLLFPRFRFDFIKQDISAGFVVFLVALPLCLGISIASEVSPISGLITGIVAGLLVSLLSGSELSVSGPAAGLTVTVIMAQKGIGAFEGLLVATMLSGAVQILLGSLRAGLLAAFFPSSVIKGMLAGIGIIIIFKQLPHAVGWKDIIDTEDGIFCLGSPFCVQGLYRVFTQSHESVSAGALIISGLSVYLLVLWERLAKVREGFFKIVPGPLVVVGVGILLNALFGLIAPDSALTREHAQLVSLPQLTGISDLFSQGPSNIFSWISMGVVWKAAFTFAIIGSLETLLSLEAVDKLDPMRRASRPNRELVAQGIGNLTAGLLGGIPMTSVIVRSSANVYAGGRTRLSSMFHGLFLLLSVVLIPWILNLIPLASLSAILIVVGYKLANTKLIKQVYAAGYDQFIPFAVTIAGVIIFDLLTGVLIGTALGLCVVLVMNYHRAFTVVQEENRFYFRFAKDVSFLQKIDLKRALARLPDNSDVIIDGGGSMFIDHDILELLEDFRRSARDRHIRMELRNFPSAKFNLFTALRNKVHDG